MRIFKLLPPLMLLLGLLLLLQACASGPKFLPAPVVVQPLVLPPLPSQARQPPRPAICLPTCLSGLTRLRESLLSSPKAPASPEPSASAAAK